MTTEQALADARQEIDQFKTAAERCRGAWTVPRDRGKWTPAQVAEHVARALEESALDMCGQRSKLPQMPTPIRAVLRMMFFNRVVRTGKLMRGRTNAAMNPSAGAPTPAAAADRLETAWRAFESASSAVQGESDVASSNVFGRVALADYIRFQGLHVGHHRRQLPKEN